jgi:hypothetical protein
MSERALTKRELSVSGEEMPDLRITKRRIGSPSSSKLLKAEELVLIPQIDATCWFNAIFTVILYSQMARKVMLNEVSSWTSGAKYEEMKRNKFMRFLYYMLTYNYTQPQKIDELFEKRIKPELLILYFAEYYNFTDLKTNLAGYLLTDVTSFIHSEFYFADTLKQFFTNPNDILNIYYVNEDIFIETKKTKSEIKSHIPKIIALLNDKICKFRPLNYSNLMFVDEITSGVINYEDEIFFNEHRYKLDACIMNNYDATNDDIHHNICGITYNNQGYVYNGWINFTKQINLLSHTKDVKKTNCPLFSRDWKSDLRKPEYSAGFCLPSSIVEKCTGLGPITEKSKTCFDFSTNTNNSKILIYVLDDEKEEKEPSLSPLLKSLISIKDVVFSSRSVSPLIKTYFNFKSKSLKELQELLKKVYVAEDTSILKNKITSFTTFYYIITNKRLIIKERSSSKTKTKAYLKKLIIGLLKIYIKDEIIFKLEALTDDKIFGNLQKEQIIELAVKIGYDGEQIKVLISSSNILDEFLILYYVVLNTYEKKEISQTYEFAGLNKLFIFLLCKYFITEGKKIKIEDYQDKIILDELLKESISNLKAKIIPSTDKNLQLLIEKLNPINDETSFREFLKVPENKALKDKFIDENLAIQTLQIRLGSFSFKFLLIFIIIEQFSLNSFTESFKHSSKKTSTEASKGGSYNYNSNLKKIKKQLKTYQ